MVHRLALKKGHIKLIGHQRRCDVLREPQMAAHGRDITRATAFVSRRIVIVYAQREGRVVIKKEGGDMVVVNGKQHVHLLLIDPSADHIEAIEDWFPSGVLVFASVFGKADGGGVRSPDAAYDARHVDDS